MMHQANDNSQAFCFSADTAAVFAFFIGGFLGLGWPFLIWGLVNMMDSGHPDALTNPVNNADAVLQAYDGLGQLGPLRILVWLFAMLMTAVVSGFISALVVFMCKHRWRG